MTDLEVRNLAMPFGAEVTGLDVTRELEEPARQRLRGAFDERSLLLFRGLGIDQTYQGYLAETVRDGDRSRPGLGIDQVRKPQNERARSRRLLRLQPPRRGHFQFRAAEIPFGHHVGGRSRTIP